MHIVYGLIKVRVYFILFTEPSCVNSEDEFGRTAAMYAVHFGEQECLETLLQGKADTSHQAHGRCTRYFILSWIRL